MSRKKFSLIKFFMLAGNFLVPCYAITMCILFDKTFSGMIFAVFISVMIVERAWETFKTSKEQRREEFHGDWTLAIVSFTYLLLFVFSISEFYLIGRKFNFYTTTLGSAFLVASFRMRFWGMAALGSQWAIHAVGAQKIRNVRLIKIGPYKYVRHPIYSGIVLEELAYPLISNAYFSLAFAVFVCVPMVILRAWIEEKTSLRRFGEKYLDYRKEVGMLFPSQLFKSKI